MRRKTRNSFPQKFKKGAHVWFVTGRVCQGLRILNSHLHAWPNADHAFIMHKLKSEGFEFPLETTRINNIVCDFLCENTQLGPRIFNKRVFLEKQQILELLSSHKPETVSGIVVATSRRHSGEPPLCACLLRIWSAVLETNCLKYFSESGDMLYETMTKKTVSHQCRPFTSYLYKGGHGRS